MKKIREVLISILLIVPTVFGIFFAFPSFASETLNGGGGGGNNLNVPKVEIPVYDDKENPEESEEQKQTWTEAVFKPYEDYFLEFDTNPITENDLSGSGSANDPYVIHNTRGFLWITNKSKSKLNLANKYVELDCDVILNDEKFDENGNPSGGDGVIYSWKTSDALGQSYLCGNNHKISGVYVNDETLANVGIFTEWIHEICDLKVDNIYMNVGSDVAGLTLGAVDKIENVHILGGTIKAQSGTIAGVVGSAHTAINVSNSADLFQLSTTKSLMGGICGNTSASFNHTDKCVNYGDLHFRQGYYAGGVFARADGQLKNCANYGEIICDDEASPTGIGGLFGIAGDVEIRNCVNYADLVLVKSSVQFCGAILGYATGKTLIENCDNYGDVTLYATILGGGYMAPYTLRNCNNYGDGISDENLFIRSASNLDKMENCNNYGNIYSEYGWTSFIAGGINCRAEIINCGYYGSVISNSVTSNWLCAGFVPDSRGERLIVDGLTIKANLIGPKGYVYLMPTPQKEMIVSNSTFEINIPDSSNVDVLFCGQLNQVGQSVKLKNIQVNLKTNRKTALRIIQFGTKEDTTLHLENILINEECGNISSEPEIYRASYSKLLSKDLYINGIVRTTKTPTTTYKQYYGNDFSGYVSSWKSGEIYLKVLNGNGLYQSKLTEEMLLNRGYKKKVI